jgi:hypothetical protein
MTVTIAATTVMQGVMENDIDWRKAVFCNAFISSILIFLILALKDSSQAYILMSRMLLMISFIRDTLFSVCLTTSRLK